MPVRTNGHNNSSQINQCGSLRFTDHPLDPGRSRLIGPRDWREVRLCNNLNRRALPHQAARAARAPDVPLAGFGLAPVSFVGQTEANPGHSLIVQIAPSTLMIDEVTQTQQQPSEDLLACKVGRGNHLALGLNAPVTSSQNRKQ